MIIGFLPMLDMKSMIVSNSWNCCKFEYWTYVKSEEEVQNIASWQEKEVNSSMSFHLL